MSANLEPGEKDFRSSYYYRSLHGLKGGEKSLGHLDSLMSTEVLDIEKLRAFCLQHTLPVYCRPLLWKVLLGVLPVYTDKETTKFIEEQKTQQYTDLRHALQVMGRIESVESISNPQCHKLEQVAERVPQPSLHNIAPSTLVQQSPVKPELSPKASHSEHSSSSQSVVNTGEEFVLLYLLENNRLLSAAENQLKNESQVRLRTIAEAFLSIFDEEEHTGLYWMFSGFVKMRESKLLLQLQKMVSECVDYLAEVDPMLYSHLENIGALHNVLPLHRWFSECFAKDLPEACLESVWDRVIAGSCMVLVFVAVAILLSIKRKILALTSANDLKHVLEMIPKENFTAIVSKGLQLWESHGSTLLPH